MAFKNVKCQTIPQLLILKWLDQNFYEEGIVSVELQSETQIVITDRNNDTATLVWRPDGIEFDGILYK